MATGSNQSAYNKFKKYAQSNKSSNKINDSLVEDFKKYRKNNPASDREKNEDERFAQQQEKVFQRLQESRNKSVQDSLERLKKYSSSNFADQVKKASDAYSNLYGNGKFSSARDYATFKNQYGNVLSNVDKYVNDVNYLTRAGEINRAERNNYLKALPNTRGTGLLDDASLKTLLYGQYKDKNDYLLNSDSEEAKAERKQVYKDNQKRLKDVQDILNNDYNYGNRFGTSLNGKYIRDPEYRKQYDALVHEKEQLQRDILSYERSNKFVLDSYDDLKNNADYERLSGKRDLNKDYKASREIEDRLDASLYTSDGEGNTYDVYGNLVTEESRNELLRQSQVQDKLGMYLNSSGAEKQKAATAEDRIEGTRAAAINEGIVKYWNELTSDEINNYYYLFNKDGKERAEQYLDSLEATLGRRNNEREQDKVANAQGLEHVWLAAKSVIGNTLGGAIAGAENVVRSLEGKEINPYSVFQSGANFASNVRGYQAEQIDQTGIKFMGISLGDVYQSVMSAVDSAAGGALLGGVGYGASMGLGAMASTARQLYEEGATTDQIFFGSLLAGVAEEVFETLSVERLLAIKDTKSIKAWITNFLKQAGTEASEEVFTEIANKLTDMAVRGTSSEALQRYYKYKQQGMSEGEATLAAFKDAGIDIYKAGAGGFISGGLGASARSGMQLASYQNAIFNQGRQDSGTGNYQNILSQAQELSENNNDIMRRLSAAQERLDQYNESQNRRNARKAGNAVGRLSQSIDNQRRAENIKDIQQALKDNGVKGNLYSKAEAINDAIDREMLGEEYSKIIDADSKVREVYDAFVTGNRNEIANRNKEYLYRTNGIVTDDQGNIDEQATIDRRLNSIGTTIADRARIARKSFDIKVNNTDTTATIDHIDDNAVYLKTADGYVVSSENIDTDTNTRLLLENAPAFGIQGAKSYINGYDGKMPVSRYTTAFNTVVMRSMPGIMSQESIVNDAVKAGLSESTALAAYYIGQNIREYIDTDQVDAILNYANTATRNEIIKNISDVAKGEEVHIENVSEESESDNEAVKEDNVTYNTDRKKLSKSTQRQIKAIGIALDSIGRSVVIEDGIDYTDDKNRVYYDAANAYFDRKDNTYHISKNVMDRAFFNIAVHETVHDIAASNPEAFKKLTETVNKYIDSNLYNSETQEMFNRNRTEMADDEEMIANITSSILSDPDTFTQFADRFITDDESRNIFLDLIDSVMEFIRVSIEKIKNKLGWQQIKVMENNLKALEDIREAYFEGLEGVRDNNGTTYNSNIKYSPKEFDRNKASIKKQLNAYVTELKETNVVATINHIANDNIEDIINTFKRWGNYIDRKNYGKIDISEKVVRKAYNYINNDEEYVAMFAVPNVLKRGIQINERDNHKTRGIHSDTFAGRVILNGTEGILAVTVQETNRTKYKSHRVLSTEGSTFVFIETKTDSTTIQAPTNNSVGSASIESVNNNIEDSDSNVKKNSVNLDALGNQLTEEQNNYFADSKIRDNNDNLKVMYHGTNADFNIFDQLNFGEVGDTAEGFGIYLTDTREVADSYGGRIIEAYANVTRPASKNAKTIKRAELARLIKATCENEAKSLMEDGHDSVEDALKDTWVSNYTYTYDKPMNAVYNQVAADILRMNDNDMDIVQEVMSGMGIRDYAKAYEFYPLLTETMGIDGFETTWEDSSNPENPAHIVVAFNSEQVKNIDNKTPTSNPDIRYSANQDAIDKENNNFGDLLKEETYSYENLVKQKPITIVTGANASDLFTEGKIVRDSIVMKGIEAARNHSSKTALDGNPLIKNTYTGRDVEITANALKHGLNGTIQRLIANSKVALSAWDLVQNAIPLNLMQPIKGRPNQDYTMAAIMRDNEYNHLIVIEVDKDNVIKGFDDIDIEDLLHSLNAYSKKRSTASNNLASLEQSSTSASQAPSTINIEDFLKLVNEYQPSILSKNVREALGETWPGKGPYANRIKFAVNPDNIDLSSLNNSDDKNLDNFKNTLGTQYKLNIAKKLTPEVADRISGRILKDVHSSYDRAELAAGLTQIINDAARQGKDLDVDTFLNEGTALIRGVLEKSAEFNQEAYDEDQNTRDFLSNTKIKLTETQQQEVSHLFESVRAYRASLFGSPIRISNSTGQSLDVIWTELSQLNPVMFPADASEGDMPVYLADAAQLLRKSNYYFNPYGFDADGMAAIVFADTIADYTGNQKIKTVVNQMKSYGKHYFQDTMKELNKKTRERAATQKAHTEELKSDLKSLKAETTRWLQSYDEMLIEDDQEIRQAEYELRQLPAGADRFDLEQTIRGHKEVKGKHEYARREYLKAQTEKAQVLQKEIEDSAKEYLKVGGKGINYAMDARQAVIRTRSLAQQKQLKEQAQRRTVINSIRRNANNLLGRLLTSSDTRHVPENLRIPVANFLQNLDLGFTGKETNAAITWIENIGKLTDKMRNFNQATGSFQVDDMIIEQLDEIASDLRVKLDVAGQDLNTMSLYRLQQLRDTISLINAAIYNSDRLLADGRKMRASVLAERSMAEMEGKKQRKHTKGILKMAGDFFAVDQLDSFSYAERLGSDFKNTIFKNLRKGFDKKVEYVQQGNEAFAKALSKLSADEKNAKRLLKSMSGTKAETTTYNLESGESIKLIPAQVMELYLLNKREDARRHIYNGGLTVLEYGEGKRNVKKQEMIQVTENDVKSITDSLTTEQKSFADSLQQFAASSVSEWGNNVSMTLWGIKKFTDQNYWRINVDSNTLNAVAADKKTGEVGMYHLKNIGISKQTNEFAKNPLIVGDIVDSFVQHVDEMSSYGAYTVPLDDAMKWYNYKDGNRTVQRSIENYMGVAGKEYFVDFIKVLNSAQDRSGGMPILDRLISNAKVAAIAANLRVVIQQPSAYARAMDVIDPKYLLQTGNPLAGAREAQEHSSIALWKNWGFRDADIGQSLREVMVGDSGTIAQRINEVTGKPAGWADDVTWGAIWNAVKAEVKDKNPGLRANSQEFYQAVSDRFTEVIDQTQVVDSPFHRSKAMRSKNMLWKMVTAFMSEPTKSYNMFYRTVQDAYQNGVNSRTVKRIGRATVAFTVATTLNSMLASLIDVVRHSGNDDDDDKSLWEKYLTETGQNLIDGLNPLNLIPIGKDIMSMIQGYDPSRLDLDAMNRLLQTGRKALSVISGENKSLNITRIVYDLIGETSKVIGVPAGNVLRTIDSIAKVFGADWFGKENEWATSKQTAGNIYKDFNKTGKWTDELIEKYVSMKTDEVIADEEERELEGHNRRYATTEDIRKYAINQVYGDFAKLLAENDDRIREAHEAKISGNASAVTKIKKIFTDSGVPGEVFDKAVLVYGNSLEESDPKVIKEFNAKLFDTDDLAQAIVNGYDTEEIYEEVLRDSTASDPEKSTINNTMRKLQEYYQQYMLEGNTRKAEQIVDKAQDTFDIDESRFESWSKSVDYMQFIADNPNTNMTQEDYNRYIKVQNSGITPDVWMQYYSVASTLKADVDANGEAISGSRKTKVLAVIDSLPISNEQKDALYYYNNWAESRINEAPWH